MTKSQCTALVERLEPLECECCDNVSLWGSHPIRIGDVLGAASIAWTEEQQEQQWLTLVKLWHECGINKSLQQILEDSCWDTGEPDEEVKYKYAISLFEFLESLFPSPKP